MRKPRVALLIEASSAYARGLLRGIYAYVREHGPWLIYLLEAEHGDPLSTLFNENWKGDGIIAHIESRKFYQAIQRTKLPVVDVGALEQTPKTPTVNPDDALIARMAVDHLLQRGFKHFGYYGDDRFSWAQLRCESFVALLREAGYATHVYVGASVTRRRQFNWEQEDEQLTSWVNKLPKPAGVMACHDYHAWRLLEICRRLDVSVPDDVAVIGVDNDELLCDLATPPLSSIMLDTHRIGYEAARILDRWMAGKQPAKSMKIPPIGVVTRQSTDVLAIADSEVSQAVRFIRDHACEGIKVAHILRAVPLSRSVLEYRFKKLLGHTPHDEILRVQFQRVTELLLETELAIGAIAERTGFRYAEYMSVAFKERFKMTPRAYRSKHKQQSGP